MALSGFRRIDFDKDGRDRWLIRTLATWLRDEVFTDSRINARQRNQRPFKKAFFDYAINHPLRSS